MTAMTMTTGRNILLSKRAFNIQEAAKYACVSRGTIDNWILRDLLPYEELPSGGDGKKKFMRIRKVDLDELLNKSYHKKVVKKRSDNLSEMILLPRNA